MTTHLGESTILEIGINYLDELCMIGYEVKIPLIQSMSAYLSGQNTYEQSKQTFLSIIGRTEPLDRLKEIVDMAEEPASEPVSSSSSPSTFIQETNNTHFSSDTDTDPSSSTNEGGSSSPASAPSYSESNSNGSRRKTRSWSPQEDTRLLAGIYKYGVDNWTTISSFIGNGRTRAQCCQRWTRGLNPRVSKNLWSYEEDLKLVQLVYLYGDKSWTKIASMMGNRSDVQCRYHYRQVMRDMPPLLKSPFNLPKANDSSVPHEYEEIKSAIEGILPSRYSMPQFSNSDLDPSHQLFKNLPPPSSNFISFAQNSNSNQANFQPPITPFASALPNSLYNIPMRPVLSLPSFDSEASIFGVNADLTPTAPSPSSPTTLVNGNSKMQLVLNGGIDPNSIENGFTPPIRANSNSSSFQFQDRIPLQANNSSPIPSLTSFCSPSISEQFDKHNKPNLPPIFPRRDSAPPVSPKPPKLKFPSPNEIESELGCSNSFSKPSHLDNFLNDFK